MIRLLRLWSLVCGTVLLCGPAAWAQGLDFGVKGGVNVATVDVSGDGVAPSFDSRVGFVAGGFVRMPITPWLAVQGEGLYAEKGARFSDTGIDTKLILTYLEVPVLAHVRLAKVFYAEAGPSMAFRLQAKARTPFSGATEDIDISDDVQAFDFGVAMGGGVELGRVIIDGRYTLGLRDADTETSDASTMKNRTISFTAGFRF
jgi:hypothetical protein